MSKEQQCDKRESTDADLIEDCEMHGCVRPTLLRRIKELESVPSHVAESGGEDYIYPGHPARTTPSTTPQKRAVALDREHQAEWNANPGLPIDEAASLSAHHCDAFRMLAHQLEHELDAANRRADARAREACTSEKRTTCSFAASAMGNIVVVPRETLAKWESWARVRGNELTALTGGPSPIMSDGLADEMKAALHAADGGKQTDG